MATTPSGPAPGVGGVAWWTSRLLSAAEGKFGLLLVRPAFRPDLPPERCRSRDRLGFIGSIARALEDIHSRREGRIDHPSRHRARRHCPTRVFRGNCGRVATHFR
jgi:hypothetical protein